MSDGRSRDRRPRDGQPRGGQQPRDGQQPRGGQRPPDGHQPKDGQRARRAGRAGAPGRPKRTDPARRAAFDTLRAVAESDAYANLVLPPMLAERGIRGRDAAFATELTYGTLRLRGRYDEIVALTASRGPEEIDPHVLDVIRLGLHQLLAMRVPDHAAVSETVALAREVGGVGRSQFVNAVLRSTAEQPLEHWLEQLRGGSDPLAAEHSHPGWIVRALRESLVGNGRPADEITALLEADNAAPEVTLVARPGLAAVGDLVRGAEAARLTVAGLGRWTPTAVRLAGGDPAALPAVRAGTAGVQDEGSQLVALAAAAAAAADAPAPPDAQERWLDMCAGPGGKAALLAAVLAERTAGRGVLVANEVAPHRAALVRQAVRALPAGAVEVRRGDGREVGADEPRTYGLVLVDAPCTGLGALRRRPEARWRRRPEDLTHLGPLQRDLLLSALDAAAVGGTVAYVTCSPHLAETHAVVLDAARARRGRVEVVDARPALARAAGREVPDAGPGPYVQLWPHRHGVDAMFLALLRRTG